MNHTTDHLAGSIHSSISASTPRRRMGPAETSESLDSNRRRSRLGARLRSVVGVGIVAGVLLATTGSASAADFDRRGVAITSSGAAAQVSLLCGTLSGTLFVNPVNGVAPNAFFFVAYNLRTGATWGSGWLDATRQSSQRIITQPGDYLVQVTIAHWNGRVWSYDTEGTTVVNDFPYDRLATCHVGR